MCIAYNFMFTYIDLLLAMFVPGSALDLHRYSLRRLTISFVGFLCFATCLCGKLAMLVPGGRAVGLLEDSARGLR